MVKRKANISIDEWLELDVAASNTICPTLVAAKEKPEQSNCSAGKVITQKEAVEHVAAVTPEVVVQLDEEGSWLWALLEQSGYERWWLGGTTDVAGDWVQTLVTGRHNRGGMWLGTSVGDWAGTAQVTGYRFSR